MPAPYTSNHTFNKPRQEFLSDCIITFVESRPYSWFDTKNYEVDLANPGDPTKTSVQVRNNREEEGEKNGPWKKLDIAEMEKAFERLLRGPVTGLSDDYRAQLIGAYGINDGGRIDVNDADVLVQVWLLGEVTYA